jgi:hypothetical protein
VAGVDVSRKFERMIGVFGCLRRVLLDSVGWVAVLGGGWCVVRVRVGPEATRHAHT